MVTLGARDRGRDNNLNLLRFVAASLVVLSHSYPLSGHLADEPLARATRIFDFASVAVIVFFAISGYLVARSFDRSRNLATYARSRALRILPAYVAATFYAALVIGPWATTLPIAEYLADSRTWIYVRETLLFVGIDRLPGVFADNPYPLAINGSLWTLWLEVFCYAALAIAGALGALRRPWLALALAVVLFALGDLLPAFVTWMPRGDAFLGPRLGGTFVAGALAYAWRDRIPLSPWIALAALVAGVALLDTRVEVYALYGAIVYVTLVLAYLPSLDVPGFRRVGDYSYGIYVYAYPTQQAIASVLGPMPPLLLFGLAYPAIFALAFASWHAIERPALRFKRPSRQAEA
ncbi:MAG TPA: acyltransferase [Casimicrobiaceae bacterium]|jgi:peptidoglycan/LPS O-acetylase OafA/YrhL